MAVGSKPSGGVAEGKAPQPMVSTPLRTAPAARTSAPIRNFFSGVAASRRMLKKELDMAEMTISPPAFVQSSFASAIPLAIVLEILLIWALSNLSMDLLVFVVVVALGLPVFLLFSLEYFLMQPKVISKRRARKIDQELVFAGRHLLI